MIRFVLGPDRQVVPDLAAKLPGRGMWLSASWDVIESGSTLGSGRAGVTNAKMKGPEEAQQEAPAKISRHGTRPGRVVADKALLRAFSRAARGPVTVPADLPGLLRMGLEQRITASLGLARRAGQAVAGFEKARDLVRSGRAGLLVQAADGSPAERARFLSAAGADQTSRLVVVDPLPGADLGRVFGRDYVVHVAIAPGKLADSLAMDAGRLSGLTKRSNRTTEQQNAPMNEVASTDE
ncbi:MAG TPA: DUF448 domain-containing protein, partial [Rhodopila sp.]|uniref:DUF448 domain-containing protein n=1 Tax=Rhodopila sp. TaxID=2480087 RepID=UPI002BDEE177